MAYRIQFRRDTLENWNKSNPILMEGEPGYVMDNPNLYKIGDGIHAWSDLPMRGFNGNILDEFDPNDENSILSQKGIKNYLNQNFPIISFNELDSLNYRELDSNNISNFYRINFSQGIIAGYLYLFGNSIETYQVFFSYYSLNNGALLNQVNSNSFKIYWRIHHRGKLLEGKPVVWNWTDWEEYTPTAVGLESYPLFNEDNSYKIGDIIRNNNVLYRFKEDYTGSWNINKVEVVTLIDIINLNFEDIKKNLNKKLEENFNNEGILNIDLSFPKKIEDTIINKEEIEEFDVNKSYTKGTIVKKEGKFYKVLENFEGDGEFENKITSLFIEEFNIDQEINQQIKINKYYSQKEAREIIPKQLRKIGLITTYKIGDNYIWLEQYIGASLENNDWNNPLNWKDLYSIRELNFNNSKQNTRKSVPLNGRKVGLIICYKTDNEFILERYINTSQNFNDENWESDLNWNAYASTLDIRNISYDFEVFKTNIEEKFKDVRDSRILIVSKLPDKIDETKIYMVYE